MKLSAWLKREGVQLGTLCRRCGYNRNTFYFYFNKTNDISGRAIKAIYDATNGEVTPNDLMEEIWNGWEGERGGGGETPDPDAGPVGSSGGGGGGALHRGAQGISRALHALADEVAQL